MIATPTEHSQGYIDARYYGKNYSEPFKRPIEQLLVIQRKNGFLTHDEKVRLKNYAEKQRKKKKK